ncbi:MAG: hypothetical protein JXR76_26425 [Deltaproteobacteria bacterium]|nr:hypothetical protein [Deltaproteobacteria bacterium]
MTQSDDFSKLVAVCRSAHESTVNLAARSIDLALVVRNWLFGMHIVEYENGGAERKELYGKKLIEKLAQSLRKEGIKGTSATNLRKFREFYITYPNIQQTLSVESGEGHIEPQKIQQTLSVTSPFVNNKIVDGPKRYSRISERFTLGWSLQCRKRFF